MNNRKKKEKTLIIFSKLFNQEISSIESLLIGETITEANLIIMIKNAFRLTAMKDAKFVIMDEIEYCFEESEKLDRYYQYAISIDSKNYIKDILSDVIDRVYNDGIVDESLNEKYINEFDFLVQKYIEALESLDSLKK